MERRTPYQAASRLQALAEHYWEDFTGYCASKGIRYFDLDYPDFLSLIRHWALEGAGVEDKEKFERAIDAPETGVDPDQVPEHVVDDEMQMFKAARR